MTAPTTRFSAAERRASVTLGAEHHARVTLEAEAMRRSGAR
jgi:hypothetical protein